MVDALVGALAKQGWEGDPEPFESSAPSPAIIAEQSVPARIIAAG
jgi:hypothetical protein